VENLPPPSEYAYRIQTGEYASGKARNRAEMRYMGFGIIPGHWTLETLCSFGLVSTGDETENRDLCRKRNQQQKRRANDCSTWRRIN
jgi:hypothetical protein